MSGPTRGSESAPTEAASPPAGLLSEDEFERIVFHIRAGAFCAVFMILVTVYAVFIAGGARPADLASGSGAIVVAQILAYAASATLLLRLRRAGAVLLMVTCVVSISLARSEVALGATPGIVVMLLAVIALRQTQRLHRLLAIARGRAG
ncbi:MAG TPA: hypothetical protein VEL07_18125 [Planctomycetota bacterium]|nr:hypothetical protein [Planctomycetota bacterium]